MSPNLFTLEELMLNLVILPRVCVGFEWSDLQEFTCHCPLGLWGKLQSQQVTLSLFHHPFDVGSTKVRFG